MIRRILTSAAGLALSLGTFASISLAAEPAAQKVGFSAPSTTSPALLDRSIATSGNTGTYVFSAPPRESTHDGMEIYGPIAEYLSAVTGKKVVYRQPANWIIYQAEMRKGEYDLVFDGAHFNAWRAANLRHNILIKAPGDQTFVVVVKHDNDKLRELKQLTGRRICGMSPPNLGTLAVLNEFDNPARQPIIVDTEGWNNSYNGIQSGQCVAAILPDRNLAKLDPQGSGARVIYKAKTYPNQALSASPRVSSEDQLKITRALTSPSARQATSKLRDAYALSGDFMSVTKDEYTGVASILKDTFGYQ